MFLLNISQFNYFNFYIIGTYFSSMWIIVFNIIMFDIFLRIFHISQNITSLKNSNKGIELQISAAKEQIILKDQYYSQTIKQSRKKSHSTLKKVITSEHTFVCSLASTLYCIPKFKYANKSFFSLSFCITKTSMFMPIIQLNPEKKEVSITAWRTKEEKQCSQWQPTFWNWMLQRSCCHGSSLSYCSLLGVSHTLFLPQQWWM